MRLRLSFAAVSYHGCSVARVRRWAGRMAVSLVVVAVAAGLALAAPAAADLQSLKGACKPADAAPPASGARLPFLRCDDGVPPVGGTSPNNGAVNAVAVPERYGGDSVTGLPPKAMPPDPNSGADSNGDIALDVDVSLPDPTRSPPPPGGYPLLVMMHGCCSGQARDWERGSIEPGDAEGWHYSNAWFASRGYVVLNYTARGFVSSTSAGNQGSTGQTQLDSVRYEINDYQYLAGLLADDPFFHVDPQRVVATGGSYGGGFSWLALTDPVWTSPGGRAMRLVAAAPKYGWTDLVYSLVPNGSGRAGVLPATDGSTSTQPLGFPKQSIDAALYASGKTGIPSPGPPPDTGRHTTFPSSIDEDTTCLNSTDPFESNPLCSTTLSQDIPAFIHDRSAYYQKRFFAGLASGAIAPVPVFVAATLTDRLFTSIEDRRMVDRLKATVPGYPVQEYYGDYQHFTQNKAREWGDVCGADHHICRLSDYPRGDLNVTPGNLVRAGVTTRLDRLLDRYAHPQGDPSAASPAFDVTASLQVCDDNAAQYGRAPADAGPQFSAPSFGQLAPDRLRLQLSGDQTTTNTASPNLHAKHADPVYNLINNASKCVVESAPGGAPSAGSGVATYDSPVLPSAFTMIGQTRLAVAHTGSGSGVQLHARMYDLDPASGQQTLVDVGLYVPAGPNGTSTFDLQGNGWRFPAGHRIRLELSQDDSPYIKASNQPSTLTISGVTLDLPVREAGPGAVGGVTVLKSNVPGSGRCGSRRRVVIRVRGHRGGRIRSARVWINGKRQTALAARALRHRRIVLTGLPAGTVHVRIRLRIARHGRTHRVTLHRTYRNCSLGRHRARLRRHARRTRHHRSA